MANTWLPICSISIYYLRGICKTNNATILILKASAQYYHEELLSLWFTGWRVRGQYLNTVSQFGLYRYRGTRASWLITQHPSCDIQESSVGLSVDLQRCITVHISSFCSGLAYMLGAACHHNIGHTCTDDWLARWFLHRKIVSISLLGSCIWEVNQDQIAQGAIHWKHIYHCFWLHQIVMF